MNENEPRNVRNSKNEEVYRIHFSFHFRDFRVFSDEI